MAEQRFRLVYNKSFPAIYLSHLDTMSALMRAIRRTKLPYLVTQGFHPRLKCSFGPALPLGFHGVSDFFDFWLHSSNQEKKCDCNDENGISSQQLSPLPPQIQIQNQVQPLMRDEKRPIIEKQTESSIYTQMKTTKEAEIEKLLTTQMPQGFQIEKVKEFCPENFPRGNLFDLIVNIYISNQSPETENLIIDFFQNPDFQAEFNLENSHLSFIPKEMIESFSSQNFENSIVFSYKPVSGTGKNISPSKMILALTSKLGILKDNVIKVERKLLY
ncbi:MAG: DUF2344 domain-containing protein [Candidatus Riflebacteria bacterium]|nr:DUF2344 domain-containing protein [Candidatus Riflebacteria bacterium]